MKKIRDYEAFNFRRYSNPWVALIDKETGKFIFEGIGGYTGGYNAGEAGTLYVTNPIEGAVYAYGRKDYRKKNGGYDYVKYANGEFVEIPKDKLIEHL